MSNPLDELLAASRSIRAESKALRERLRVDREVAELHLTRLDEQSRRIQVEVDRLKQRMNE